MKRFLQLLALSAFTLNSAWVFGQGWQETYLDDFDRVFKTCSQTQDGGYILSGVSNHCCNENLRTIKTDSIGNEEWSQVYVFPGQDEVRKIIQTQDGNYVAVGSSAYFEGAFIARYDEYGDTLWYRHLQSSTDARDVIELDDQSLMVLSRFKTSPQSYSTDVRLTMHSAQGALLWSQVYGSASINEIGDEMKRTPDGGFVIAAHEYQGRLWLLKVDAQGAVEISEYFNPENDWPNTIALFNDVFADIRIMDDGGFMISVGQALYWMGFIHMYRTDATGTLIWKKRIGRDDCSHQSGFVDAHDNGQVAVGNTWRYGPTNIYLVKVNDDGEQIWHRSINAEGSPFYQNAYSINRTTDGGFIIGGRTSGLYALKVDSVGSLGISCGDTTFLNPTICDGQSFSVGSSTYTQSGTYVDRVVTVRACDSIIVTNLSISNQAVFDSVIEASICDGDVFSVGTYSYTTSGTYVQPYSTSGGCDSTITVNLSVIDEEPYVISPIICFGESFTVGSSTYDQSGVYTDVLQSSLGCDSTVITELTVLPSQDTVEYYRICQGEWWGWFGGQYSQFNDTGMYVFNLPRISPEGCDYTLTYELRVNPHYDTTITATICEGDVFQVGTYTHTQAGIYDDHFYTVGVCDSVVHVNLTVVPDFNTSINALICDGQSFSVGTYTYTSGGTYVQSHVSAGGCDSIITINITEGQGYDISLSEMICEGDVFTVGSSTYDQPGVYVDSLMSVGGCDSVITTELSWGLQSPLGFPVSILQGTVFHDQDGDCEFSAGDVPLDNWVVEAAGNQTYYGTTNVSGDYSVILPHGSYDISAQTPVNWQHCGPSPTSVSINGNTGCYVQADIGLEPTFGCALLDLDLSVICLVPCSTSTYHLNYHNIGTETAYNPTITFAAGPYLTVNWSSVPWETPQNGTIYEFQLDSVPAGASGWIAIAVTVDCDAGLEGYSVCSGALHDAPQCCPQYAQYNGPEIALEAECDENGAVPEVEFRIKNIGDGDMNTPLPFYILQDDIVYNIGTFQLNSQQQDVHTVFATGSMYRMEAQQDPGHPYAPSPAIEVEGCGTNAQGMVSLGYSDILENGDQIPSIDFNCTPVTQTCSCNQLYSSPIGIAPQHYVDVDEQIEYTVTFQNQLSTEVQKLVIIDTLPEELDPATIIKGESSHEFEFSVSGNGVVTWTMNDIALPYGTPGTQDNSGFVKFTADLREDVQVGSVVYNSAKLYFDEEEGITTNETLHTVGRLGVDFLIGLSVDDIKNPDHSLHVFPNPFSQSTTIELKGVAGKNAVVEIYDMLGKQVQRNRASDNLIQINRQGMADGVYSYRVIADGQLLGTGKLVVGE